MTELETYITNSGLSEEDKNLWSRTYKMLNPEISGALMEFIDNKEENLNYLTENLKLKKEAIEKLDLSLIDKIIKQEQS